MNAVKMPCAVCGAEDRILLVPDWAEKTKGRRHICYICCGEFPPAGYCAICMVSYEGDKCDLQHDENTHDSP